jgi:hypothetical protein
MGALRRRRPNNEKRVTAYGVRQFLRGAAADNTAHTARVKAQGADAKGRGSAQAEATFRLEPSAAGSKVLVHTNLTLSGAVAQYGRGVGMIQATASTLMNQFANNLKKQLTSPAEAGTDGAPAAAKPISATKLAGQVAWHSIKEKLGGKS